MDAGGTEGLIAHIVRGASVGHSPEGISEVFTGGQLKFLPLTP
jgi:hypothetical protein